MEAWLPPEQSGTMPVWNPGDTVTTTPTQASAKTETTETTPQERTTREDTAPRARGKTARLADTLRAPNELPKDGSSETGPPTSDTHIATDPQGLSATAHDTAANRTCADMIKIAGAPGPNYGAVAAGQVRAAAGLLTMHDRGRQDPPKRQRLQEPRARRSRNSPWITQG